MTVPQSRAARVDHIGFVGGKFVGYQPRAVPTDEDHVLNLTMIDMRLHGDHHSFLQRHRIAARDHRFLPVPPAADAVSRKHRSGVDADLLEARDDECVDVAAAMPGRQWLTAAREMSRYLAVLVALRRRRHAENGDARLMTGIGVFRSRYQRDLWARALTGRPRRNFGGLGEARALLFFPETLLDISILG